MINTYISIDPRHSSSSNATAHPIPSLINQPVLPPTGMSQTIEQQDTQQREEANTIPQGTNRSSYDGNMLARKLTELALDPDQKKRYPVKRSPVMSKSIQNLAPNDPDQFLKLASGEKEDPATMGKLLSLLKLGPHQQYLGWLLLSRKVPSTVSDPEEADLVAKCFYQDYRKEKNNLIKLDILNALDMLGKPDVMNKLLEQEGQGVSDALEIEDFLKEMKKLGVLSEQNVPSRQEKMDKLDSLNIEDIQSKLDKFFKLYKLPTYDKTAKIKLCYALGKNLSSYLLMPGDGWKFRPITSKGNNCITGIHFEKDDHLSVMNIFNDQPQLPNNKVQAIQTLLDQAVKKNIISEEERARALSNLEPVSTQFAEGSMVADLVILPKMIDGQEKNYVYVECTPKDKNHLQSRQVFMTEDIVMDADNNIRLSDMLREDIQRYFLKKGWDNCLGKTLCLKPEDSVLNTSNLFNTAVDGISDQYEGLIDCNNKNLKTLENAFLSFSTYRAISKAPEQTPDSKAEAECKMKAVKDQIYRWARSHIRDIDPKSFKDLMDGMTKKISIVTYSECLLQILKAIDESLKMQKGSGQDFENFKMMLNPCRNKLARGISTGSINTAEETVVYLLVNKLNTTITALGEKIAAHKAVSMHQSEHLAEEEKMGS